MWARRNCRRPKSGGTPARRTRPRAPGRGRHRRGTPSSWHLQFEAVDECARRRRAEPVERRAREPEPGERCGLGPRGRGNGELVSQALGIEDENEELVTLVGVRL